MRFRWPARREPCQRRARRGIGAAGAPAPARPWARLLRGASGKDVLAVLDQAVVSGTSFLTTILLWRGAARANSACTRSGSRCS